MKYLETLKTIFLKNKNIFYFFTIFFIFFWVLRILPNWEILWELLKLKSVSWNYFFDEFWFSTIGIMKESSFWNNLLAFIFPALTAINIILFKELYLKQRFILKSKSLWASLSGMFLGLFGVGCAACSGLLLAPLISFFGLGWIFKALPWGGVELALGGIIIMLISIFYLLKKIFDPVICEK